MAACKSITIVGGGLAGLTLGIGLRRAGISVTVWEAGQYPRHRVCGEFINGRGQGVLDRLGLSEGFKQAGARTGRTAAFFSEVARSPVRPLEPQALCLSRFEMDRLLAERFRAEGGDLRENSRWNGSQAVEAVVFANGRKVQPLEKGWRWFGLKIHARRVKLEADLEMHLCKAGYVGLCHLPEDKVNVCGLFRNRPGESVFATQPAALLRGSPDTPLHERLSDAVFDQDSFCSVAGLSLRPQRATAQPQCRLGDAMTMTPPVTGNGMSMAFEAAELAVPPLAAYARSELSWAEARQAIARACDAAFGSRLFWARWLEGLMFSPLVRSPAAALLGGSDWLWYLLFARTR